MAISGSNNDFERQKFVESPTRPNNAVPEIVVGSSALPAGAATESTLQNIYNAVDGLEGFTDGLEGLQSTTNTLLTATNNLLTAISNQTDQLEGFTDDIEPLLTTIRDNADTVETLLSNIGNNTDTVESLISATNTLLTTIRDNADQLEGYLDGVEGFVDGLETNTALINTTLITGIATELDKHSIGSIIAGDTTSVIGPIACNGASTVKVQLTGTFTGSIVIETTGLATPGASDWTSVRAYNETTAVSQNPITTGVGTFCASVAGSTFVRVRRSTAGTGTVNVEINVSSGNNVAKVVSPNQNDFLATVYQGGGISNPFFVSNLDGQRRTYTAGIESFAAAAAATDIFTITGSATTTVRILRISIATRKTAEAMVDISLLKRSTDNTGGTSTTLTAVPHDSNDTAATNSVRYYTANPTTLGTLLGVIQADKIAFSEAGKVTPGNRIEYFYGANQGRSIVLRGVNEVLSFNLQGKTVAGSSISIDVTWTEE